MIFLINDKIEIKIKVKYIEVAKVVFVLFLIIFYANLAKNRDIGKLFKSELSFFNYRNAIKFIWKNLIPRAITLPRATLYKRILTNKWTMCL